MERIWFVLRMGGGEGLHHSEDQQAGHVQVNIELNKMASSNQVNVHYCIVFGLLPANKGDLLKN